jgi:DNA-binding GntR family transcriptional regulator
METGMETQSCQRSSIVALDRLYSLHHQRIKVIPPHSKLFQNAREYVISKIRNGEFPPGAKISEARIAQDLSMSQIPVREAMIALNHEGWVERVLNKGVFVKQFDLEEMKHLFEVRELIEIGIIVSLAEKITDKQLAELYECLTICEDSREAKDFDTAERSEAHFHRLLVNFYGNDKLEAIFESILSQAVNLWFRSCDNFPSIAQEVYKQFKRVGHRQIYEALKQHDAKKAKDLLSEHLEVGYRTMVGIRELMDSLVATKKERKVAPVSEISVIAVGG